MLPFFYNRLVVIVILWACISSPMAIGERRFQCDALGFQDIICMFYCVLMFFTTIISLNAYIRFPQVPMPVTQQGTSFLEQGV